MFVKNFDRMYKKLSSVIDLPDAMFDQIGEPYWNAKEEMPMHWDDIQKLQDIKRGIDIMRERGVSDDDIVFSISEVDVLSRMPHCKVVFRYIKNGIELTA